jgi:DNA-binding LacI/PurR family transcriptional regulator
MRGPAEIPDSEYRWLAIQSTAKNLGLKIDPELVVRIDTAVWTTENGQHPMTPEIGYKPMQALLEKRKDFTAAFCFNDIAAIGAIRALHEAGLSVPQDVSVVGFDDIQSAAYSTPSLTTVRQPLADMGRRGAQILLSRIQNSEQEFPGEVLMTPELIIRESTGPAPKR